MPATRTKPKVRGLFTLSDAPPIVAKAVTSSKSGQVQTFVSRDYPAKPQEPENEPNNAIDDDDAAMFSPADIEFGPAPSTPETISGITVKAPAKRYANSKQMMDVAWFPAMPLEPQTCATFALLREFHALNLQGKVSGYDFYKTLVHLTDGTGLTKLPDRLQQFMLLIREWRHLKMAKRSGRGHDPFGIAETKQGGLAIDCCACPHPNINLPTGWEDAPPDASWLYQLILSQDANFRLKNRLRSTDDKDPALGPGFAYFVASDEYLRHLANYVDQDEISHCVGFAALWLVNTKKVKGLRATGVGSYSKNFWERLSKMPSRFHFVKQPQVRFKVPKFHLPPHKVECHGPFALNYTSGVRRTDGEGVERNWSWLNGAAPSTSQMGPGARHDTLDDFMGYWNFRKTVDLGDTLLKRLVEAIPEAIVHRQAFTLFTESLQHEHSDDLHAWEKMLREWEADQSKPDPYLVKEDSVSVNEIRRQLAKEEQDNVKHGGTSAEMTPANFVLLGLDIEDTQLLIHLEAKQARSPTQLATLAQKRTTLLKKIQKFREGQRLYLHGLAQTTDDVDHPETLVLELPSSLSPDVRSTICQSNVNHIEDRLCEVQASESLSNLRRQLRVRTFARKFKDQNASSQGSYTRMRALHDQIEGKIKLARDRYNLARAGLLRLRGPGEWEITYRELKAEDIRAINERTLQQEEEDANQHAHADLLHNTTSVLSLQTGDGRQTLSWIWYHVTTEEIENDVDGSLNDGIRLEWFKARARARR
ncbi:hypothetical protein H0H92_003827 [Tricholoma furcatifolium]|nr:hypothetical protein H0H92_003827 [Tricholoma furcatifolium]